MSMFDRGHSGEYLCHAGLNKYNVNYINILIHTLNNHVINNNTVPIKNCMKGGWGVIFILLSSSAF